MQHVESTHLPLDAAYDSRPIPDAGRAALGLSSYAGAVVFLALALLSVGVVIVGSASASLGRPIFGGEFFRSMFSRHMIFVAGGVMLLLLTPKLARPWLSTRFVRDQLPWVFGLIVFTCLILVLMPGVGTERRGSQRWLTFGPRSWELGFQPSEFAKLGIVLFLAWFYSRRTIEPRRFLRGFFPGALCTLVAAGLVGKENLSTGALLYVLGAVMLFAAGCRWRYMPVFLLIAGAGFAGLAWLEPYRITRLTTFMDIWNAPPDDRYHGVQSLITIASGGWWGRGLGNGVQKYGYLPESRTDFIFAIICEETGVAGGIVVMLLYAALVILGMKIMWRARTRFERLAAFGITAMIGMQAVLNVAVVTVWAPTTGVALPLVSAGGTGILMYCMALGLLAGIALRGKQSDEWRMTNGESGPGSSKELERRWNRWVRRTHPTGDAAGALQSPIDFPNTEVVGHPSGGTCRGQAMPAHATQSAARAIPSVDQPSTAPEAGQRVFAW